MSAVIEQLNPFQSAARAPVASNAIADAAMQREVAEVQGAIAIAKRFPRDVVAATDRILQACTRPTLAESALYSYSRGGSDVTGPSIRLAEMLAQNWGNLQFGIRELEQRNGESTVEAFAWDTETNVRQTKVFQVPHERHTKAGVKRLSDPRDVYELVANQGARRLRACILGVIPGDVTEAAVKQCETTLKTRVEVTPELIKSIVEKFAAYNVTREMIEKRVQRHVDAITPALVVQLGKILNSLRDGMSAPSDWFEIAPPPPSTSEAVSAINDRVRGAKSAPGGASAGPEAGSPQTVVDNASRAGTASRSGSPGPDGAPESPPISYAQWMDKLRACTKVDQVDDLGGMITGYPRDQQVEMGHELGRIRARIAAKAKMG